MRQEANVPPGLVAGALDNPATLFLARLCLASPFLIAGLGKLFDWQGGVAEMEHVGLSPAWAFNLASMITELTGSALIILNWKTWLGAGALGIFTLIATFLAHRFWDLDGAARTVQMNSFFEHAAICAGFILVAVLSMRQQPSVDRVAAETRSDLSWERNA
jgi:transmembrane protein